MSYEGSAVDTEPTVPGQGQDAVAEATPDIAQQRVVARVHGPNERRELVHDASIRRPVGSGRRGAVVVDELVSLPRAVAHHALLDVETSEVYGVECGYAEEREFRRAF